jgi:hypothetical protein
MNRSVRLGLVVAGLICVVGLPLGYRHRRQVHGLLHRIGHRLFARNTTSAQPVTNTLEIGGKKYADVLGYPPYYLAVTQFDAVLFVTRLNGGGSNVFHLLSVKTGQEEQIPTIADFGRNIGATNGGFRDYVERAGPGEVVVASESDAGNRVKTVYHLDLAAGIVNTREVFYYDSYGHVTNISEGPGF